MNSFSGRVVLGQSWKREIGSYPAGAQFDHMVELVAAGIPFARTRAIGNLIHVNRSDCIDTAKKIDAGCGETVFESFDSDGIPRTTPAEALAIVQEDFDAGAGIVCAPVHSIAFNAKSGAQTPIRLFNPDETPKRGYFECSGSSLTWMFLAPLALKRLLPGRTWSTIQRQDIPLYCWSDDSKSEDFILFERVRELGMKTGCDGRLVCGHYKEVEVPGYGLLPDEVG